MAIDWIPAEVPLPTASQPVEGEPIVKRRRVRKRKRRPQNFEREYQDEELYPDRTPPRPRLRRPLRTEHLDQDSEQWRDEMMSEEPFRPVRPYKRRRLYPKYEEIPPESEHHNEEVILTSTEIKVGDDNDYKSYTIQDEPPTIYPMFERIRDPYTALREDNKKVNFPRRKLKESIKLEELSNQQSTAKAVSVPSTTTTTTTTTSKPLTTTRGLIDLKQILKQAGGISLSELLQQKNLTLQDLINGEHHAISALTKMQVQTTEANPHQFDTNEEIKPKRFHGYRRIPSLLNRKNINQDKVIINDGTSKDNDELDKRVTSPFNRKETKYFPDFKFHNITTETTTERRIFVPSHPKYYTSIDFKPNMKEIYAPRIPLGAASSTTISEHIDDEENSVETTTSTSTQKPIVTTEAGKPRRKITLPPTLFKLRNRYPKTTPKPTIKETETENYPVPFVPDQAIKININELFGISNLFNISKTTEGPLKISVDIQTTTENSKEYASKENLSTTSENISTVSTEDTSENSSEPDKVKSTSARDEMQEILSDTMSRETLMSILEARNMTLRELLEQRERGSSQRHLADIFHNQTREPEPKELVNINVRNPFLGKSSSEPRPAVSVNTEIKYPANVPKLDHLSIPTQQSYNRESRQNQYLRKQAEDYNIINNPLFRTDSKKTHEVLNKLIPVWRQAYTNMHKNQPETNENVMQNDIILNDEATRVEEIENQIAEAVNGALNEVETISHKISEEDDDDSYLHLPYGVRSAVIASATIVGISLLVFITIFIIFKLSQKKHKHLAYSNSLSSLKIRSPILETPYQKRIFGSLMDSTLGRKKKISTISSSEPQSLQDYLWENDRKPFQ